MSRICLFYSALRFAEIIWFHLPKASYNFEIFFLILLRLYSNRASCDDGTFPVLLSVVVTSHTWLLSTWNIASMTKELNCEFYLIFKKFIWKTYNWRIIALQWMSCWFLPYNNVTQPWLCICSLLLEPPSNPSPHSTP